MGPCGEIAQEQRPVRQCQQRGNRDQRIDRLKIRPEKPEDYKATELMTMRSFFRL